MDREALGHEPHAGSSFPEGSYPNPPLSSRPRNLFPEDSFSISPLLTSKRNVFAMEQNDDECGYAWECSRSRGNDSDGEGENVPPGRGRRRRRGSCKLMRNDSRSPSPTPKVYSKSKAPQHRVKNPIHIENPRDGVPYLTLKPGTKVKVYFDSKSHSKLKCSVPPSKVLTTNVSLSGYCWITLDEWNFGWCIERSDLEDEPDHMPCVVTEHASEANCDEPEECIDLAELHTVDLQATCVNLRWASLPF